MSTVQQPPPRRKAQIVVEVPKLASALRRSTSSLDKRIQAGGDQQELPPAKRLRSSLDGSGQSSVAGYTSTSTGQLASTVTRSRTAYDLPVSVRQSSSRTAYATGSTSQSASRSTRTASSSNDGASSSTATSSSTMVHRAHPSPNARPGLPHTRSSGTPIRLSDLDTLRRSPSMISKPGNLSSHTTSRPAVLETRTSKRKKDIISDLMSRGAKRLAAAEQPATRVNKDVQEQISLDRDRPQSTMPANVPLPASIPVEEQRQPTIGDRPTPTDAEEIAAESMQIDDSPPTHQEGPSAQQMFSIGKTGSSKACDRLPSPAPSNATNSSSVKTTEDEIISQNTPRKARPMADPIVTPVKAKLDVPKSSTKKRTPTKAVKVDSQKDASPAAAALHLPGLDTSLLKEDAFLPTPLATPDRQKALPITAADLSTTGSDARDLLEVVLRQLSDPSENVRTPAESAHTSHPQTDLDQYLTAEHETSERDVRATLDRTIREGEGNCLLLVGERGIGKTAIVNRSIELMCQRHGTDGFLVVRLSGLVQRDDKSAIREIARQLCSSSYIDDAADADAQSASFTTNANILSSLLAILEPGPSDDAEEAASKDKPLIFVIDEFDLFAHHSVRQSFLYCLLDCVQGGMRRSGMAVLGLSARADCIETLEKRVKSRCQSRVHHILPAEDPFRGTVTSLQAALRVRCTGNALSRAWNDNIEAFFKDRNVQIQLTAMSELRGLDADRKLFDTFHLLLAKRLLAIQTCANVSFGEVALRPADLLASIQYEERVLPSTLSVADLAMLIATKHLTEEERPINFVITYERYSEHCRRAAAREMASSRPHPRHLCLKSFERLKALNILRDAVITSKSTTGGSAIFKPLQLVIWPNFIDEAVKTRKDIPQHLVRWCKSWSE